MSRKKLTDRIIANISAAKNADSKRQCKTCEWWRPNTRHDGSCRYNAPVSDSWLITIQRTQALFLWWYIRERSNDDTASAELKNYFIHLEDDPHVFWPQTSDEDWCGRWQEVRPMREEVIPAIHRAGADNDQ